MTDNSEMMNLPQTTIAWLSALREAWRWRDEMR
jgi:hypothetical protein